MNLTGRPPVQKPPKPERGTARAKRHLEAVKRLPCVVCGMPGPSDAHHCFCGRYGSRKPSDFHVIPLCKRCHQVGPRAIHNGKTSWIERNGYDYDYLPVVADMLAGEWTE